MSTAADSDATRGARPISCLVVDDHAIVREGLRRVLSQLGDMVVVGEAPSGEAALELVALRRPQVVLMDARMPGIGGVAAARAIVSEHPAVRVVMFTAHAEQDLLFLRGAVPGHRDAIVRVRPAVAPKRAPQGAK